jgi:hypothetical protein
MANSDFAFLPFYEHLGDNKSDIPMTKLPFMGLSSSVKRFNIEGNPLNGYVLIKVGGIQYFDAEILINDRDLPEGDIGSVDERALIYNVWFDEIPRGYLKYGENTIQIKSGPSKTDNFLIFDVVVHWRETASDKE